MLDPIEIAIFAALGVAFALGVVALTRWSGQNPIRICAYALIVVSFLYVGLGLRSDNPNGWVAVEMTGVAVFGSAAWLGVLTSPWITVLALALHPFWAIVFHYVGTGSAFTPAPFAIANSGFDIALALYAAYSILRGDAGRKTVAAPEPTGKGLKGRRK